ncbi:MAG: hypothetical protein R3B60_01055 [Candidatus Paceibacterota bacterium]
MAFSRILKTPYFLFLVSGILLGIGFVLPVLWVVSFFGILVFLLVVTKNTSFKKVVLGGWLAFTTKSLFATSMFFKVNPEAGLNLMLGHWENLFIFLYWVTVSLFLGSGGALLASGFWFLQKKINAKVLPFLFVILFIFSEVFGSLMFSILTFGVGATINTAYSLGYFGYLLAEHETLLQFARWGGVYILSALGAVLGYGLWLIFSLNSRLNFYKISGPFIAVLFFSASWSLVEDYKPSENKTVLIVDTTFTDTSSESMSDDIDIYKHEVIVEAVTFALSYEPDYLILPEGSYYNDGNLTPESAYKLFRFQTGDTKTVMIDVSPAFLTKNSATVRATIYDGVGKEGYGVDKQSLTPQGEFMPYIYIALLKTLGFSDLLEQIRSKLYYQPGPLFDQTLLPDYIPSVMFCFEGLDPKGVRKVIKGRESVPFVAHPVSHSWFDESEVLNHSLDTILKVQAVWNQVPVVSAGNMSEGALYSREGIKVTPEIVESGKDWKIGIINL